MANHQSSQDDGLSSLASVTGGHFVPVSGTAEAVIGRMLRETSAYYTATFAAAASEHNGQPARLELKSTRSRVALFAHPSLTIPKDASGRPPAPKDMLRVTNPYTDLPLRAGGYSSRVAGSDDVKVVAMFETVNPADTIASASFALFDETNTLKKQWTGQASDFARRPILAAVTATPGTYRLRVAAVDGHGRAGTVDYPLEAELIRADPLKLSALVLGTQSAGGSGFAPRLEFMSEPTAIGYLEIYGVPSGHDVEGTLDLLKTPDGPAITQAAGLNVTPGGADDIRIAFGGFNIEALPAGDYIARATILLDGKAVGRAQHTLRKR